MCENVRSFYIEILNNELKYKIVNGMVRVRYKDGGERGSAVPWRIELFKKYGTIYEG